MRTCAFQSVRDAIGRELTDDRRRCTSCCVKFGDLAFSASLVQGSYIRMGQQLMGIHQPDSLNTRRLVVPKNPAFPALHDRHGRC